MIGGSAVRGAARAALLVVALLLLGFPARAELRLDITRGTAQPLPIAIPPLPGPGDAATVGRDIAQVVAADLERSGLFRPVDQRAFIQTVAAGETPALRRLAPDQRAGFGDRLGAAARRRPPQGRVPAVGCLRRAAARRLRVHDDAAELAAHRACDRRPDLQADHRRGRLFRHADRLYRRIRAGAGPRQAARDHGPGRRQ